MHLYLCHALCQLLYSAFKLIKALTLPVPSGWEAEPSAFFSSCQNNATMKLTFFFLVGSENVSSIYFTLYCHHTASEYSHSLQASQIAIAIMLQLGQCFFKNFLEIIWFQTIQALITIHYPTLSAAGQNKQLNILLRNIRGWKSLIIHALLNLWIHEISCFISAAPKLLHGGTN